MSPLIPRFQTKKSKGSLEEFFILLRKKCKKNFVANQIDNELQHEEVLTWIAVKKMNTKRN